MNKTLKRFSAILLAVVMLISAVPFASATPLEDAATNPVYVTADEARGFLTYSVADGKVTITGYTTRTYDTRSDYITIEFPDTIDGYPVVAIGDNAFENFVVDKLILPSSITKIGNGAFNSASSLDVLVAPGVTEIGDFAFAYSDVVNFTLPENLQKIGKGAFLNCKYAEVFVISADNEYFLTVNGVLFNKDKTELIAYPLNKSNTGYAVPESVETIAPYAFARDHETYALKAVEMTNVKTIGERAFSCTYLESVDLGKSLVNIGAYAFEYGNFSEITLPKTVRNIGERAFQYCTKIQEITIPEGVTRLEDGVLYSASLLKTLYLPGTLSYIGRYAITENLYEKTVYYNGTLDSWKSIEKDQNHGFAQQDMTFVFSDGTTHTHTIDYKDVVNSTCSVNGSRVPYCTVCGEVYEKEIIGKLPHTEGEWVVTTPATTNGDGERKKFCTVCNAELKSEAVTELAPGVEKITYIKSTDTHNSFVVTVKGRASMVQFIEPDGGTRTYFRNNKNVKIVSYNKSGTTVNSLSRDLAYELWEINTNLSANVEIRVRAKYYFFEENVHRWDTSIYKFTVQLREADKDAGVRSVICSKYGPQGAFDVKVITGPDAEGVRFVMPNGTTTTYVRSTATLLSSGLLEFTGKAWANREGTNEIQVQIKVNRVWQTVTVISYYAS